MGTADDVKRRWNRMKSRSDKREMSCCSLEAFPEWYESQEKRCGYCGIEEEFLHRYCTATNLTKTLHIDRMINSEGYILGKMILACHPCNSIIKVSITEAFIRVVAKAVLANDMLNEYHLWTVPAHLREAACGWHQFTKYEVFDWDGKEVTRIEGPNEFFYLPKEEVEKRVRPLSDDNDAPPLNDDQST